MPLRTLSLVPLLLCGGCLARDIAAKLDELDCSSSSGGAASSTTMDCPDTSGSGDSLDDSSYSSGVHTSTEGSASASASTTAVDETGTSTTATSDTTGEPVAICGNGMIEAFGPAPEDCDDGNDIEDDGCRDCGRERRVFVTSETYQGGIFDEGGVPSGLAGADQRCQHLAAIANFPDPLNYRAWLSDSQYSARDRLFAGRGRYVLANGLVVADSWQALLAGELQNPIDVTELSETKAIGVHTGTNPDGTAAAGSDFCADWSENGLKNTAHWGASTEITADWTLADVPVDQPGGCEANRSLYCFEQG